MMFILNEGYSWFSSHLTDLGGVVYLAQGNDVERMRRRPQGNYAWKLFDPQMYLAGLSGSGSTTICARLASYPWFGIESCPELESGEQTQQAWRQQMQGFIRDNWPGVPPDDDRRTLYAASAVLFQAEIGCTHILTPCPLVVEREDEAESCALWIDASLEAAEEYEIGQPIIATIAISESVLNDSSFNEGGFLDTVVDQVVSRDGLGGVYIVVAQTQARHPLLTPSDVNQAYAHLTNAFAKYGYEFIFVNFADVFGVTCLGLGATGFATGRYQSHRRLCLASMEDVGGGAPLPRLYSHKAVGEFLTEREMEAIARNDRLGNVEDVTPHSRPLYQALRNGTPVSSLPAWAESRGNVTAAAKHFIARMVEEGRTYSNLSPDDRLLRVNEWLEIAQTNQHSLFDGPTTVFRGTIPMHAPIPEWQENVTRFS